MQIWLSLISIILSFFLACQCSYCARRKGYDTTVWFMAGAFFGIFALLVILFLKDRHALPARPKTTASPTPFSAFSALQVEKFWYFLDEHQNQFGPMSFSALKAAWDKGTVQKNTFVWNEAMEEWKPLQEVIQVELASK